MSQYDDYSDFSGPEVQAFETIYPDTKVSTWLITMNTNTSPGYGEEETKRAEFENIVREFFSDRENLKNGIFQFPDALGYRKGISTQLAVGGEIGGKQHRIHAHAVLSVRYRAADYWRLDAPFIRDTLKALTPWAAGMYVNYRLVKDNQFSVLQYALKDARFPNPSNPGAKYQGYDTAARIVKTGNDPEEVEQSLVEELGDELSQLQL
jgi:hypothetical protein